MLCVFLIVPILAPLNSRSALPIFNDYIAPHNLRYVLLCRNYIHADLFDYMAFHSENYDNAISGLQLIYLDAGFPFIHRLPLLPHLSHNDGRKIDIAFPYLTKAGAAVNSHTFLLAYGVYKESLEPEITQAQNVKMLESYSMIMQSI
jgi:hypothetical protein